MRRQVAKAFWSPLQSIAEVPTFCRLDAQHGSSHMITTVVVTFLVVGTLAILAASVRADSEKASVVSQLLRKKA
jgi:hypothetical protein